MAITPKTRVCTRCSNRKPLTARYFYRGKNYKHGFAYHCKTCRHTCDAARVNITRRKKRAAYWADPISARQRVQEYRSTGDNRQKLNERRQRRLHAMSAPAKALYNAARRAYAKSYQPKRRMQMRTKRANNIQFRLKDNLRRRLSEALAGSRKSARTVQLLGCTPYQLREYLERRFKPGMTWGNYGPRGWHVDHVKPCDSFDLTKPHQQRACFHFSNLQPLWAIDNARKGAKCPS